MKRVTVMIEKGQDGSYGAYLPDENPLGFGVIGDGNTAEEAKQDFLNVYQEMRDFHCEKGIETPEVTFVFKYDVPSFLNYYTAAFSLVGMSHITGIAKGQLSHYVNGTSSPSMRTVSKIEHAMREYGRELSAVKLI